MCVKGREGGQEKEGNCPFSSFLAFSLENSILKGDSSFSTSQYAVFLKETVFFFLHNSFGKDKVRGP